MATEQEFILGEAARSLDERYRVSLPALLCKLVTKQSAECILAKERPGCLSLWSRVKWQAKLDDGVDLVRGKMQTGRLEGRIEDVQQLGRLLSTRHRTVQLAGRGRLAIPEGFREFLAVEPGEEVLVVGAAVCVELWHPSRWLEYVETHMPDFRQLLEGLAG